MSFKTNFLGQSNAWEVELPLLTDGDSYKLLHYTHFSTCFFKPRSFAHYCACNIPVLDSRINIKRPSSKYFQKDEANLDPNNQIGQDFYYSKENDHPTIENKNLLDRGHVIRREYPQWETKEIATKASRETFYFTNVAPQYHLLNQGDWQDLEDFVIDQVQNSVSVFSGCIFDDRDPVAYYEGAKTGRKQSFLIPLKFWKVVYYVREGKLHRIGFVLSQEEPVKSLDFVFTPNERINTKSLTKDPFSDLDTNLVPYIVDVDAIGFATGLTFTPAIENIEKERGIRKYFMDSENQSIHVKFSRDQLNNFL